MRIYSAIFGRFANRPQGHELETSLTKIRPPDATVTPLGNTNGSPAESTVELPNRTVPQ